MNNQSPDLKSLFSSNNLAIPQYQRAYAWTEEPQLEDFLADLRQQVKAQKKSKDKNYFLGTFLLHEHRSTGIVDIVDGQQRLTTSVIFIAAALARNSDSSVLDSAKVKAATLRRTFIYDEDEELQKLRTIKEDNHFFRSEILGLGQSDANTRSHSCLKLLNAKNYFLENVADEEWSELVDVLISSKVMTYVVQNAADATQIFELQNDRGKKLTELESLKSYLMHLVYLHDKHPGDRLDVIQCNFAEIYRSLESIGEHIRAPKEDAIFSYHCAAFENWTGDDWRSPKQFVKKSISKLAAADVTSWIEGFVCSLKGSFKSIHDIYENLDDITEMSDLLVLGRLAPFWPLIIKTWQKDNTQNKQSFKKSVRLMEVYSFRGYGISNLRADSGLTTLYTYARDFVDFDSLNKSLFDMCYWYELQKRFDNGLDAVKIYKSNRSDVQYLLWKYENGLRSKTGNKQPLLTWKNYLKPSSNAAKFSVEHIAAQNNQICTTDVKWMDEDVQPFSEIALHRLGNLVLDSISSNAAKGDKDFAQKLDQLSQSTYRSHHELINFSENRTSDPLWSVNSVIERHQTLVSFAKNNWNPEKYL